MHHHQGRIFPRHIQRGQHGLRFKSSAVLSAYRQFKGRFALQGQFLLGASQDGRAKFFAAVFIVKQIGKILMHQLVLRKTQLVRKRFTRLFNVSETSVFKQYSKDHTVGGFQQSVQLGGTLL